VTQAASNVRGDDGTGGAALAQAPVTEVPSVGLAEPHRDQCDTLSARPMTGSVEGNAHGGETVVDSGAMVAAIAPEPDSCERPDSPVGNLHAVGTSSSWRGQPEDDRGGLFLCAHGGFGALAGDASGGSTRRGAHRWRDDLAHN